MNADNLVTMANQIGAFFETMPDREQALTDIAGHLKRFWEPRMRRSLLQHMDEHAGVQLKDIVLEALRTHRASVL
ncbi:formate dehydrogenase subunit delta [Polaromonas sp. SM01]|uniref:formate dehydrogenase subunit delta n=1 Tax=Polaromonas sp. SM01 TaxID=3085630 RepID=UPI002980FB5F|nr:formate dehydrogenase subunit delta [Polaromonas sp. SM01]MDW5444421.1 formate dehydrogenase subunit delta [Polaromonas sp. SM01]